MLRRSLLIICVVCCPVLVGSLLLAGDGTILRAGLIGLDTSHVTAFTRVFNAPEAAGDLANVNAARIVGGASTPTDAGNFKQDPNASGEITFADLAAVNASRLALNNGAITVICP